jgi:uncharacterized protein YjbI with pentapeptide repeats
MGQDLSNMDLTGANLEQARLEGANLTGAILTGTRLWLAHIDESNRAIIDASDAIKSNYDGTNSDILWIPNQQGGKKQKQQQSKKISRRK